MPIFKPKENHDIIFKREFNFSKINGNIAKNYRQKDEPRYIINNPQSDPINYKTNIIKEFLCESSNNIKSQESNKTIINNKKENFNKNSSIINNPSTKLKYFNIVKNISRKNLFFLIPKMK